MSIDHHIYNGVVCYERHQVVPFSNGPNGAVTTSTMSLTLSDEEEFELAEGGGGGEERQPITKRTTLLFDHAPSKKPSHGEIRASRDYLKEMCRLGYPDIQRNFPDVFSKFLSTSRLLNHFALSQLLNRANSMCPHGK